MQPSEGMERMAAKSTPTKEPAKRGLIATRVIHAPPEVVFKAWIDSQQLAQWWGPKRYTNPVCELDARPDGAIHIEMRSPDGKVYPIKGVYQEIVEPERLVFTGSALDTEGAPLFEVVIAVSFLERGSRTILRVHTRVLRTTLAADAFLKGMMVGWPQSLERLEALVLKGEKRMSEARRR